MMSGNMINKDSPNIKVVMFPWLAYGHITPYLELAKKLSTRGYYIFLCSTEANLAPIKNNIPQSYSNSIQLVTLQVSEEELPRQLHTTNGLPTRLLPKLRKALDKSGGSFKDILQECKPDLLIYDFLQPWAPLLGISSVIFITSSSTMNSFMYHHFNNPETDFPHDHIRYHHYESWFMDELLEYAKDKEKRERLTLGVERSSQIVLIKGFREIEAKYIDYVSSLTNKKFVPVGPLVQEPNPDIPDSEILSWLDGRGEKSTVFVSFGTEYFPKKKDMVEIALGLELSNVDFIWVIRFPKVKDRRDCNYHSLEEVLPLGFLESVEGRGRVVEGWAPQAKILAHANTGGFVTHCGWNSIMESMKYGVPMIAVPMQMDQPINARLVVEVGVGLEVLRDKDKRLCREAVAAVVDRVVIGEDGRDVRRKAAEMREMLEAKGDVEMVEVVDQLEEAVVRRVVAGEDGGDVRRKAAEMREMLEAKGDEEVVEVVEKLMVVRRKGWIKRWFMRLWCCSNDI